MDVCIKIVEVRTKIRAEKTMTATDVTGFDAIFSTGFFATFSRFSGALLTKMHINLEKEQKIQWRASSGDGAPKLQISVPCRGRTGPDKRMCFPAAPVGFACVTPAISSFSQFPGSAGQKVLCLWLDCRIAILAILR